LQCSLHLARSGDFVPQRDGPDGMTARTRASRVTGNSCGPRTGTRLATDGGAAAVTPTACLLPSL